MPQLSLYLDDSTMELLRGEAQRTGTSLSKYAGAVIRERSSNTWPQGFFNLYGCIDDETFEAPEELPLEELPFSFDALERSQ